MEHQRAELATCSSRDQDQWFELLPGEIWVRSPIQRAMTGRSVLGVERRSMGDDDELDVRALKIRLRDHYQTDLEEDNKVWSSLQAGCYSS
jgi:hypothetical protein